MTSSRRATLLPSIFGPSRRAAWRLSVLRRGLSAAAILLALQLTLGATSVTPAPSARDRPSGAAITLPLAVPADHISPGDEVAVYLPGRTDPVVASATALGGPASSSDPTTVRITVPREQLGPLLLAMTPERGGGTGFVIVGTR